MTTNNNITNDVTAIAAMRDGEFSFRSGDAQITGVGGQSPQAVSTATYVINTIGGMAPGIAKQSAMAALVAGSASMCALGQVSPAAAGIGAMAGVINSVIKCRS